MEIEEGYEHVTSHVEAMGLAEKQTWERAMYMVADFMGDDRKIFLRRDLDGLMDQMLDAYKEMGHVESISEE